MAGTVVLQAVRLLTRPLRHFLPDMNRPAGVVQGVAGGKPPSVSQGGERTLLRRSRIMPAVPLRP